MIPRLGQTLQAQRLPNWNFLIRVKIPLPREPRPITTQEVLLSVQFKHSIGIEMPAQASKVPASNKAQSDGGLSLVQHGLCREVAKPPQPDTLGRCIKPLLLRDLQCWALSRADQLTHLQLQLFPACLGNLISFPV